MSAPVFLLLPQAAPETCCAARFAARFARRPWRGVPASSAPPSGDPVPRTPATWSPSPPGRPEGGELPSGGADPRPGGEHDKESWLSTCPPSGAPFPLPTLPTLPRVPCPLLLLPLLLPAPELFRARGRAIMRPLLT